jgi:hypothetical protein
VFEGNKLRRNAISQVGKRSSASENGTGAIRCVVGRSGLG